MEQAVRKLVDLSPWAVKTISRQAKAQSISFKKYVENLVEEDAKRIAASDKYFHDIDDEALLGLIGVAKSSEQVADDKLNYILSKLG